MKKAYVDQYFSNNANVEAYARQVFGMDARTLELMTGGLSAIMRGYEVPAENMQFLEYYGKQVYNWQPQQTRAILREISQIQNPGERMHAFLTAGGGSTDDNKFELVKGLVEAFGKADMEMALTNRLEQSQSNHMIGRDQFDGMPSSKNTAEAAKQRDSLRGQVEFMVKGRSSDQPKTLKDLQRDVMTARNRLANRIEGDENFGKPKSLRESLDMAYSVEKIDGLSQQAGLGSVKEDLDQVEEIYADLDPTADVTESLRDY